MTTKHGILAIIFLGLLLTGMASSDTSRKIKKGTSLSLSRDRLAFEVAEGKYYAGLGNGTGTAVLTGIAIGLSGQPMPDMSLPDHSNDPDYRPEHDSTVGVRLRAGMRCRTRQGDRAVVLGSDASRVLIEVSREHYFYAGSDPRPALVPTAKDGDLSLSEIEETPACLNKMKLWIDQDVFFALQGLPAPKLVKKKKKGADSDDAKEAVRRAIANQ